MNTKAMSDNAILKDLGERIAKYRLNQNMKQDALAMEAGVSKPTVQRMENGISTQVVSLVRVLRALHLIENLDALVPQLPASPIQQIKLKGKQRRRASAVSKPDGRGKWSWGDEA